jgi:Na+/proline symporter
MFSATLSTLSGDFNVIASVLTNDIYRRLVRPNASQKECVVMGRIMTLFVGLIVLGLAVMLSEVTGEGLVRNMFKLFSIATAPVAIPMMLGLLTKKISNAGSIAGFSAGILVGIVIFILCPDETRMAGYVIKQENVLLVGTMLTTLLVSVGISFLYPAHGSESIRVATFLAKLETPIGDLPEDHQAGGTQGISPFRIVGICTLAIGLMLGVTLPFVSGSLPFYMVLSFAILLFGLGGMMVYRSGK